MSKITQSTLHERMKVVVLSHPAIHNDFLTRFSKGEVTAGEFDDFATEFFHFSRTFPAILANLLVNTPDEAEALELTKVLTSELGDGDPSRRHELLFRKFLRSVGIDPARAVSGQIKPSTDAYLNGLWELYGGRDHVKALGASFGLENMAIPMWDQLLPGLRAVRERRLPNMDIEYFTFHRELESQHEDAMEEVTAIVGKDPASEQSFESGIREALDLLHGFWVGLEGN
ncbi:MAG TPA: iron-containing redox enzyme family protein [Nitrososphaerales archaeon]|nr:iron-containing redox enzyme family protein [Nitrososphaerales archaeon]